MKAHSTSCIDVQREIHPMMVLCHSHPIDTTDDGDESLGIDNQYVEGQQ
jgi:hypothetical protein